MNDKTMAEMRENGERARPGAALALRELAAAALATAALIEAGADEEAMAGVGVTADLAARFLASVERAAEAALMAITADQPVN